MVKFVHCINVLKVHNVTFNDICIRYMYLLKDIFPN